MKHYLNKDKFLDEMKKRGWQFRDDLNTWVRPASRTQHEAEQDWINSILESIECPLERQVKVEVDDQGIHINPKTTSETLKNA